jgi:tRNA pseudouridine38-40 synthase
MSNYRLDLEYNGARYRGWQAQKNAVGVANVVEGAARAAFKDMKQVLGAGRTDAGVHALQQVCHVRSAGLKFPTKNLVQTLNDALPPDVAVTGATKVDDNFDARKSAVGRVYLYQILRRRASFGSEQSWWVRDRLDLKAMRLAVPLLVGRHNFAAFSDLDPERPKETSLDLDHIEIVESGPVLLLRFRARFFLWKMVRRLTGYLVETGRGRYKAPATPEMFKVDRKVLAPDTAPPQGLFLERVLYPGDSFNDPMEPVLGLRR